MTCQARLKVLSPEAIGQIVACPRCESMVQIIAPEGWTEAAVSASPDAAAEETSPEMDPLTGEPSLEMFRSPAERHGNRVAVWGAVAAASVGGLVLAAVFVANRPDDPPTAGLAAAAPAAPEESQRVGDETVVVDGAPSTRPNGSAAVRGADLEAGDAESTGPGPDESNSERAAASTAVGAEEPVDGEASRGVAANPPAETRADAVPPEGSLAGAGPAARPALDEESDGASDGAEKNRDGPRSVVPPGTEHALKTPLRLSDSEVALRLDRTLGEVQFPSLTLAALVDFLSTLSGVPMTLDLESLAAAGVDHRREVSVGMKDATIVNVLVEVLSSCGLAHRVEGGQVVIGGARPERRRVRYRIGDLIIADGGGLSATADNFAASTERLVAPGSWASAGGRGTIHVEDDSHVLVVEQTPAVHYQVLAFCEKLRTARRIPLRSRHDPQQFQLDSRLALVRRKLDQPVTFTFFRPTTLRDVCQYLAEAADVSILVDWQQLADARLGPESEIRCAVADQPLGAALSEVLQPMGLGWRSPGVPGTIQILTHEAVDRQRELEFYAVEDVLESHRNIATLLAAVRGVVGDDAWQGSGGQGVMVYDPVGRCLLVLQPQAVQRRVEQWLDAERRKLAARG